MGWVAIVTKLFWFVVKAIWGTDKPQKTVVTHPSPDLEVDDGKTDKERLKDLDL